MREFKKNIIFKDENIKILSILGKGKLLSYILSTNNGLQFSIQQ